MPLLILLGSGIALNNTKAVVEAFLGVGNIFRRTPKFNIHSASDHWQNSIYSLPLDGLVIGELALGLYSLVGAIIAALNGHHFAVPFILLYALGFGYVGLQGVWDARQEIKVWLSHASGHRMRQEGVEAKSPQVKRSEVQAFNREPAQ
jgi:hypothetical protein